MNICIVYDIIHIWHIPIKNWAIDVVLLLYSWEYCFCCCCCCWGLSFLWILTWDIISHLPSYENITLHNGDWLFHTPSHWCCIIFYIGKYSGRLDIAIYRLLSLYTIEPSFDFTLYFLGNFLLFLGSSKDMDYDIIAVVYTHISIFTFYATKCDMTVLLFCHRLWHCHMY